MCDWNKHQIQGYAISFLNKLYTLETLSGNKTQNKINYQSWNSVPTKNVVRLSPKREK